MQEFGGRVAVVTGGASGIGAGMARAFAAADMHVVVADVELARAEHLCSELRDGGRRALAVETDVSRRESVEELAERSFDEFGAVHLLCNNAGVCIGGSLADARDEDWRWLLSVNLEGVVHGCQAFVPRLVAQGQAAHIVNTASMGGWLPGGGLGIYATTKFAVVALSESLRQDLRHHDIGVSALCPGFVKTELLESARNRPPALGASEPQLDFLKPGVHSGADPVAIGERVLRGVRDNQTWIFTHPEMRPLLEARFRAVLDAFDG